MTRRVKKKLSKNEEAQEPGFFRCDPGAVLTGALASCLTMLIYLKTLAPTVTGEDSGELISAAYSLGIPHPPGYPLWTLLGRLFTLLPVGDVAYRVNLMSAFFGSLTVFLLVLIGKKITGSCIAACAASLIFGFSNTFWSQAVIAEVYTLNAFLLALIIFLLLTWKDAEEPHYLPFHLYSALSSSCRSLSSPYMLIMLQTTSQKTISPMIMPEPCSKACPGHTVTR